MKTLSILLALTLSSLANAAIVKVIKYDYLPTPELDFVIVDQTTDTPTHLYQWIEIISTGEKFQSRVPDLDRDEMVLEMRRPGSYVHDIRELYLRYDGTDWNVIQFGMMQNFELLDPSMYNITVEEGMHIANIPEPSSIIPLLLGCLAVWWRR